MPESRARTSAQTRKNAQRLIPATAARRSDEPLPSKAASAAGSPHHVASGSREGERGSSGVCVCVDPGYGREFPTSLTTGAETGSLPLAPRSRQTCASLPHRVTHRCPWKARQKHALRAENITQSHRKNAPAHPSCGELAGGEGQRKHHKRKFTFNESERAPSGCSCVLLLRL